MSELSQETIKLVRRVIENSNSENGFLLKKINIEHLSKDEVSKIVDLISDEFARRGLDDNDEPNEYGMQLESAIDRLLESVS